MTRFSEPQIQWIELEVGEFMLSEIADCDDALAVNRIATSFH
jgi:hypothetical protein